MRSIGLFPLGLATAHDAVVRRRVGWVCIAGVTVLLVAAARIGIMESEAWLTVGRRMLRLLMSA